MRKLAFIAPLAVILGAAVAAQAEPAQVTVALGPDVQKAAPKLGEREVDEQSARLAALVRRALEGRGALDGARIDLVLADLKPNRPTFQQISDRPGLDGIRSRSIGGAAIEGQVTTADGQVHPVRYDWYSTSIAEVSGHATWTDADRAFSRFAANLAAGRYVTR
jgi:hypothetical protein